MSFIIYSFIVMFSRETAIDWQKIRREDATTCGCQIHISFVQAKKGAGNGHSCVFQKKLILRNEEAVLEDA